MIDASLTGAPYRVEISAGGHALVGDEPEDNGGKGAGASPFDLVVSGLAACTLITLRMYADRKGWAGFRISGQFRHRMADGAHRIERRLQVSGVPDAAALQRLGEIAERTPVTLALKAGFAISTELVETTAAERPLMSHVHYEIVEHDGGWAYRVDGVYSETFPSHDAARQAAERAAGEQRVSGEETGIVYEDAKGRWHGEVSEGDDRPQTDVEG